MGDSYPSMNGAKFTSPISLATNSTFNFVGGYTGNVSSNISGSGSLNINSDGSGLNLSGTNNTYTGLATVNIGTVNVSNNQSAANGGWAIGPASANVTTVNFLAGSTIAISSAGGLQVGNSAAAGSNTQALNVSGVLNNSGSAFVGRDATATVASGGTWNQSGNLTIQGAGGFGATLAVSTGGLMNYASANPITINAGTNAAGNGNLTVSGTFVTPQPFQILSLTSPSTGNVQLQSGGVLRLSGNVADLTPTAGTVGKVLFQLNAGGGVIDTNGFNPSLSTVVSGAGGLTKVGNGTLTLSNSNTYTGVTLVNGGVLALANNSALAGSTLDTSGSVR